MHVGKLLSYFAWPVPVTLLRVGITTYIPSSLACQETNVSWPLNSVFPLNHSASDYSFTDRHLACNVSSHHHDQRSNASRSAGNSRFPRQMTNRFSLFMSCKILWHHFKGPECILQELAHRFHWNYHTSKSQHSQLWSRNLSLILVKTWSTDYALFG